MATDFTSEAAAVAIRPLGSPGSARSSRPAAARFVIYVILALFCLYYLLPLYVMVVNSLKPLSEIQAGGMMSLPQRVDARALGQAPGRRRRSASPRPGFGRSS